MAGTSTYSSPKVKLFKQDNRTGESIDINIGIMNREKFEKLGIQDSINSMEIPLGLKVIIGDEKNEPFYGPA